MKQRNRERESRTSRVSRRDVLSLSAGIITGGVIAGQVAVSAPAPASVQVPSEPSPPGVPSSQQQGSPHLARSASRFPSLWDKSSWDKQGVWEASWVSCPAAGEPPFVSAYRLRFALESARSIPLRVTADERYELFLDGKRIGRGSERGNLENWFYETYEVDLTAGPHTLVAVVWSLGRYAPLAQFSVRPGFLLAAPETDAQVLNTGMAGWEAKPVSGYSWEPPVYVWGLSAPLTVDGTAYPWGVEQGRGDGWRPVRVDEKAASALQQYGIAPLRFLRQGTLPAMMDRTFGSGRVRLVTNPGAPDTLAVPVRQADHLPGEEAQWQDLLRAGSLTIPPATCRRVIIDLDEYVCAYPEIVTSRGKGSRIRLQWAEALRVKPEKWEFQKGNRDQIEGKYFLGMGDTFLPDGAPDRLFTTLWWAAGRYLELVVTTGAEPLTIERFTLRETRYPLEMETRFSADNDRLMATIPMMVRGMQTCSHETYVDCPYFEQMQYVGDARVEALCNFVMSRDDRLARKALYLIDVSRHAGGLTEARAPVREPQFIPWFSLVWVAMVHDYAYWRDDKEFVRNFLPGVRAVMDAFRRNADGIILTPDGWNDTDSVRETGVSGLLNWQYVGTLQLVSELEREFGEPEYAARAVRVARELAVLVDRVFWDEAEGFYADDPEKQVFSEPVQAMATLAGLVPRNRLERLAATLREKRPGNPGRGTNRSRDKGLRAATVYSTHYLFEAYRRLGLIDLFYERLHYWYALVEQGFKTPIESYDPSRSDCHAWGSHPLYHCFATILGIRPSAPGFSSVEISPNLGPLTRAEGCLFHPAGGEIRVCFERRNGKVGGEIELPKGLNGVFRDSEGSRVLKPGRQAV